MKVPRRFVTKLSLATVLVDLAAFGWGTPAAMAGKIDPLNPQVTFNTSSGLGETRFSVTPNPAVFAEVHFNPALLDPSVPGAGHQSIAGIQAQYGFIVHGPHPADLDLNTTLFYDFVNLFFGQTPDSSNTFYDAFLSVALDFHKPPLLQLAVNQFATGPGNVVAGTDTVGIDAVSTDIVHIVTLFADISIFDRFGNANEVGQAEIDPVITFAPGFDSTGFSLEFAPGVGNEPDAGPGVGTPEPSTLVLSSILFGTWSAARGYRRLKRTIPAA